MNDQSLSLNPLQVVVVSSISMVYTFALLVTIGVGNLPLLEMGIFALIYLPLWRQLNLSPWKAVLFPAAFSKGLFYLGAFSGLYLLPLTYLGMIGVLATLKILGLSELPSKMKMALIGAPTLTIAWIFHLGTVANIRQSVESGDNSDLKIISFRMMYCLGIGVSVFAFAALLRIPKSSKLARKETGTSPQNPSAAA